MKNFKFRPNIGAKSPKSKDVLTLVRPCMVNMPTQYDMSYCM